ncbi:MAG TPA: folate-binding protein [Acidimicrobiia bacterium]|nr:folate-binding protein [Acidimicrobiia bacterium]HZQ75962.1 folate-binding protein [Acidimicrobiia bacterium]
MSDRRTPLTAAREAAASEADDLGVAVASDFGDPAAEERAFADGAALVDRCARGAVLVEGPDGLKFLQSLLSQDIDTLSDGQGTHALLLQPQGKLDTDLRLLRVGDTAWLDCEVGRGEALAASLRRFRIRIKADVEDRTGDWGCLTLRGPEAAARVEAAGGPPLPGDLHAHVPWGAGTDLTRLVRADWPGGPPGADLVGPVGELEGLWTALRAAGFRPAGLLAFEAARVRAGVPRQGLDIDERTIPQEAFLELDAVSFTKGCFLGQELVCRIDSRGHVNRLLRTLRIGGGGIDTTPPSGAGIVVADKEVGALTTVARSEGGVVALGFVRREVEVPADVLVRWSGGEAPAVASALPERP